ASDFSIYWTTSGRSHTGILVQREKPEFRFDPDSIAGRFLPYERIFPDESWRRSEERVIAPVPDKAKGLKASFMRAVHQKANELASRPDRVICIGYSFNPHDRASYAHLLRTLAARNATVILVSPDALEIRTRLA